MKIVIIGLGFYYTLIGIYILFAPIHFYANTPGVSMMGPFNSHFITDVSLAFLASGGALLLGVFQSTKSTIIAGALWPLMHALFHVTIWVHRGFKIDYITVSDFVGVILPGLCVMLVAIKYREVRNA